MTAKTDILLKEYEACQSHNNSIGNQTWISISIIITVNLLLLGQIVTEIVLKSVSITERTQLALVILLGAVMIIILWIFGRWYKRVTFQMLLNRERMREIETKLGMWKNWRVYGLDLFHRKNRNDCQAQKEWKTLLPNQRKYIKNLDQCLANRGGEWRYRPPTTKGFPKFNCIFPILISLWVLVIATSLFVSISVCNMLVGIVVAVVVLVAYAAVLVYRLKRSKKFETI